MSDQNNNLPAAPATDKELSDGFSILEDAKQKVDVFRKGKGLIQLVDFNSKPLAGVDVEITQKTQDFLFGNLVFDLIWEGRSTLPDLFKRRFLELFNLAIFPFYWSSYEKSPGMEEWQHMLPVLEWCKANGVTPKGHPLVWPYSAGIPEWLYDMPVESVESLIYSRVTKIVKGFQPSIMMWDVTNEAVNHISWEEATKPDFRQRYHEVDLWRGIPVAGAFKREIPISEAADWVEKSLRWAHAANPMATLIVNDYNQEIDLSVRQRFYDLILELKRRGAPISGIGLQVHPVNYWIWPQHIKETLDMYNDLEVPVHITELHQPAWDEEIEGGWRQGIWTEEAQADFIEQLYRQCYGHPSVVSINYWGLSDRNIWIQGAGLVDAEYHPKPVFHRLKSLIKKEWKTSSFRTKTNHDGKLEFVGFFGQYELLIQQESQKSKAFKFHLAENEENQRIFFL
jgi:endo-1,4-beta-xylanase